MRVLIVKTNTVMLQTYLRETFRSFISRVVTWGVDEDGDLTVSFFKRLHFTHYSHGTLMSLGKRPDLSDLVPRTLLYEPRDEKLRQLCLLMHIARDIYLAERSREHVIAYVNTVEAVYGHIDSKRQYTLSRR